jgi:hypothetical protein
MARSVFILSLFSLMSVVATADDYRIPKEQFYERVHTIALFPVENVVWENMNDLYRYKDIQFHMEIKWGFIRINDYKQLADTMFIDTIQSVSGIALENRLKETRRFGIINAEQTRDSIKALMVRFNVRNTRNPMWGNYEHPYKDTLQQCCLSIMKTDAILISGYHLDKDDKGYFVKYSAIILDPISKDTLWSGSNDMDHLCQTNAKNIFYDGDCRGAVNRTLKSIKKQ